MRSIFRKVFCSAFAITLNLGFSVVASARLPEWISYGEVGASASHRAAAASIPSTQPESPDSRSVSRHQRNDRMCHISRHPLDGAPAESKPCPLVLATMPAGPSPADSRLEVRYSDRRR